MILGMGDKPKGDSMDESGENYITPPQGFEPPDDAKDGQSFDITVRCHMEGDKICPESINGMPMDSKGDSDDAGGTEEDDSMDEANNEANAEEDDGSEMGKTPKNLDEAMAMQKKHSYAKQ